jgi:hypothetical protein
MVLKKKNKNSCTVITVGTMSLKLRLDRVILVRVVVGNESRHLVFIVYSFELRLKICSGFLEVESSIDASKIQTRLRRKKGHTKTSCTGRGT